MPFLFLAYCIADGISTRKLVRKQPEHPLVGSPSTFVPKFILNVVYAWKATDLAQEGYDKVRLNVDLYKLKSIFPLNHYVNNGQITVSTLSVSTRPQ